MLSFYCGKCHALDEKGARAHRCATQKTVVPALAPQYDLIGPSREHVKPKPGAEVGSPVLPASTVDIPNAVPNTQLTPAQRSAAWKKANREAYNAQQRALMKKRRAASKAKRAAS